MKPDDKAWARALKLYSSPGFRGAYLKGARAALAGLPASSCPYRRKAGWYAWRAAWLRGYHSI